MSRTLAQQLEDIDEAIAKVESGVQQITSPDGRVTTFPTLAVLYKRKDKIEADIVRAAGGDRRVAEF